jgi:hypothetical protein
MNLLFMKFCSPAQLYLLISFFILLYFIIRNTNSLWYIGISALIFIAVTFGLNKLCDMGFKSIAWLLAIFPPAIYLLFIVGG